MINLIRLLVLLLAVVASEQKNNCELTTDVVEKRIKEFLKESKLCEKARELFVYDGSGESSENEFCKEQYPSVVDSYMSEACWTYKVSLEIFKINIKACVSEDDLVRLELLSIYTPTNSECKGILRTIGNLCADDSSNGQVTSTVPEPTGSDPASERQHDASDVCQGHSGATTAIIGVTSFIVGVLVALLCHFALYCKRNGILCFARTEKPNEGLSSGRVTKRVLAKHMRSVRHDSPASDNVVHYVSKRNEKGVNNDTEGMYSCIDQPDAWNDQQSSVDKGRLAPVVHQHPDTEMKTQQAYTDITFSNPTAVKPTEEHVYNHLELERQAEQTRKTIDGVAKDDQPNDAVNSLRIPETTNSDMFDCGRDSSVSGHDYFVLQNENFRTSQQVQEVPEI